MKSDTSFVVQAGEGPVVFSTSPDSPVAPYLVELQPSSLDEMYKLGIISSAVAIEHLLEAREIVERISIPDEVFVDEKGQWVSDRGIPDLVTIPRASAVASEVIRRTTLHLEQRGYGATESALTAQKAAYFLSPVRVRVPTWIVADLTNIDLDVQGTLYISPKINQLKARSVFFRHLGWIVPAGSYFMLTCERIHGEPRPPDWTIRVRQKIAGVHVNPGDPVIKGWTDRLSVTEIQARAQAVSAGWR